ncbi:hypothetical protein FHR83_006861 [Actinoplanes campanulatus]|uniref:AAA+ ATPase domain-containing protein n=1 Tax=Actinoplanes campanulatus TaxID=113559 RepID=A0A7W5AN56_9ACTN|nr:NB-ARC domain-containing protein [Actinoplanes campanulatus]MBB3099155.1 hypothetical protein [Actinoplanes campanulatus]GGN38781.1 hypothetical protein GCM10010109_65980 [Actinoplanes campanulatus]GID40311.1 hypothetical protein Aca09nite_68170 [Actinoplanes campanulatus]
MKRVWSRRLRRRSTVVFPLLFALVAVTGAWQGGWWSVLLAGIQLLLAAAVATVLVWPDRPPRPARRPTADRLVGRAADLNRVIGLLGEPRATGAPAPKAVLIHGMPGVGKTTLARRAADAVADHYPDGHVRVSLTDAGVPVASGDLLTMVLQKLAWAYEIPANPSERASLFRARVSGRRILFVFDDAQEPSQLTELLPNAPGSLVIITSRRNLSPQLNVHGFALDPLPEREALDLLCSVTGLDGFTAIESSVRLVQACGRLPGALQALGARVADEGADLALLSPESIAADLGRASRPRWATAAVAGIAAEFGRLSRLERDALCLLTQVRSRSFASWVLGPLLRVSAAKSDVIATTLAGARLLEPAGRDDRFELARYRFHPLVRTFAEAHLNQDADLASTCRDALDRLRGVYLELARSALDGSAQHPLPGLDMAHHWIPETSPRARAAECLAWIRFEQESLWEEVPALLERDRDFALRLVAGFTRPHPAAVTVAARTGWAEITPSPVLAFDYLLAHVRIDLIAGRYEQCETVIDGVRSRTRPELLRGRALMHLTAAEVYGELGWAQRAKRHVAEGEALLGTGGEPTLRSRLEAARQLADPYLDGPLPDDAYWRAMVSATRHHVHHRHRNVIDDLCPVTGGEQGDDHRRTMLHRRLAQANWELHDQSRADVGAALLAAARHAMLAVLAAESTGNRWEQARGRLLLARALTAHGRDEDACTQRHLAEKLIADGGRPPPYLMIGDPQWSAPGLVG